MKELIVVILGDGRRMAWDEFLDSEASRSVSYGLEE